VAGYLVELGVRRSFLRPDRHSQVLSELIDTTVQLAPVT
jgi:hypothetical protein